MLQFASADEVTSALGRDVPTANFDESARSDRQGHRPPPSPPLPPRAASEESTWGTWRGRHEISRTPRSQASAARGGFALPRRRMVVSVPVAMSATATPSAKSISAGPMDGIVCAHPRCEFLLAQSDSSDGFCCPACLQAYYALRLPELHSPGCCKTRMVPGAARARPSDKSEKGMAWIAYAHWNQGPASVAVSSRGLLASPLLAVPGTPPGEVLLEAPPYSRFKRRRKQLAKAAAPPGSDTDLSFKLPAHRKSPLLAATAEPMEYWMPQTPLGEPPACRLASMRRREPQQPPRLPTGPTRFDGAWRINGGSGQIEQINCGCLEGATYLGLIGEARCVVDIDGETYEGSLSSDKQTISWSDGDTWLRAGNLS